MNLPDIVGTDHLAEALGCDVLTVQQRAIKGDLPGVKYGRGWVFPREALLEALNHQARTEASLRARVASPDAVGTARPAKGRRRAPVTLPDLP